MSSYYKETIIPITEQVIENEIREDIENMVIEVVGEDGNSGYIESVKNEALDYIEDNKRILASSGDAFKETALQTRDSIKTVEEDTDDIAENTIFKIEQSIRQMIVDNGYIMKIVDDGIGNADIVLVKEVV